jgi:predicted nucleotidyltransferase
MKTWNLFKAQDEDNRFQIAFQAIAAAVSRLTEQRDGGIASIVLFGSLARRRPSYDDIDLLIIIKWAPGTLSEITRRLAEEVFGPLFLEYGEVFSPLVYTDVQFVQLQDRLPLLDEIRREGVLLYGQDPFAEAAGAGLPADR